MADLPLQPEGRESTGRAAAWLAAAFAAWLVGSVALVSWALNNDLASDAGFSVYHLPGYAALLALLVASGGLVVRARRHGRSWRAAYPAGLGWLGAGLIALLGYVVADVAWREGVGIGEGIEEGFAPSRILLAIGMALVAAAPLRAALGAVGPGRAPARWPGVVSAGLTAGVLALPGGLNLVANPWLEFEGNPPEERQELWLMDADGSRQTRLVEASEEVHATHGTWSPDGRWLAYTRWTGKGDDLDASIWVVDADGSGNRPILEADGWQWFPDWSPDGQWIAYTDEGLGGPWMDRGPSGPAAGGAQGPAFDAGAPIVRRDADIWRIRADGSGAPIQVTDAPGDDRAPVWSPDGAHIAFDATRDGNTEVYVVDADGSDPVNLSKAPGDDWTPAWSPDGARIAFNSDRSGWPEVHLMAADGTGEARLTSSTPGSLWPTWSADGTRIAFTSWRTGETEIWSVAADGSDPRNLSRSPATNDQTWTGNWGPDGRIAFHRSTHFLGANEPAVRGELGVAVALIQGFVLVVLAAFVARLGPPFGAIGAVLALAMLPVAATSGQWRFVLAGLVAGLAVDLLLRVTPRGRRAQIAGSATGAAFVVAAVAAVAWTAELAWSGTLVTGLALALAAIGWAAGTIIEPRISSAPAGPDG